METDIRQRLFRMEDPKYADFQAKLTPGIAREDIIGVRVPEARKLAKELYRSKTYDTFLIELPHRYLDENMLHALIISEIQDYEECIVEIERFLPFVNNWAVCDILSPKCLKKHKDQLIYKIREWISSAEPYTCRFGMEMLMTHYLDDAFQKEYLDLPAHVYGEDYYVKMMVAWFFATALAKQWDASIAYIENRCLEPWTHNKTIQKARESYRITQEQKAYLKGLKQ